MEADVRNTVTQAATKMKSKKTIRDITSNKTMMSEQSWRCLLPKKLIARTPKQIIPFDKPNKK